ncbi:MAG: PKD domain-containing protein [Candidatus Helarchaeota archaeon]
MDKKLKIITVFFISIMMLNMTWIDATYNSIVVDAHLQVNKLVGDVNEELIFSANQTTGPWGQLVYIFHDGADPVVTMNTTVKHAFPAEGIYLVILVAIGTGGITSIATVEVTIENTPPTADILMPSSATEDEPVTLKAVAVNDTLHDLPNLNFQWVLGDGEVQTGREVNYSWAYAGLYPITLHIIDDQGALDYALSSIEISNVEPAADFLIKTGQLPNGTYLAWEDQSLEFNANATFDTPSDLRTARYYWNFQDGTVGQGKILNHTFHQAGTYSVKLTVRDNDGASNSTEEQVIVLNSAPSVSLPEESITLSEGDSYTFVADSEDTITDYQLLQYRWSFGEPGWRTSHVWTDDWQGNASVEVQDPEGLVDTDTIDVEVLNVPPKASVSMAYIQGDLTLRAAGMPNNTIELKIMGNGELLSNCTLDRIPGDPDSQAKTMPFLLDLSMDC